MNDKRGVNKMDPNHTTRCVHEDVQMVSWAFERVQLFTKRKIRGKLFVIV